MRILALTTLLLILAVPVVADDIPLSGPVGGLRTPALDMGQAGVITGMNKAGNYNGGT